MSGRQPANPLVPGRSSLISILRLLNSSLRWPKLILGRAVQRTRCRPHKCPTARLRVLSYSVATIIGGYRGADLTEPLILVDLATLAAVGLNQLGPAPRFTIDSGV